MIPSLFWAVFAAALVIIVVLHVLVWRLDNPRDGGPTWRQRRAWKRERADITRAQERRR